MVAPANQLQTDQRLHRHVHFAVTRAWPVIATRKPKAKRYERKVIAWQPWPALTGECTLPPLMYVLQQTKHSHSSRVTMPVQHPI